MKTLPKAVLLAVLFPLLAPALDRPSAAPDREKSPDLIITSELENRSRVLILKDRRIADSLLRLQAPPLRGWFDQLIGDSAVAEEVGSREEFRKQWRDLEAREGFLDLRAQHAARDVDKTRIPRLYLFDSTVVVYPGWIILRSP